MGFRTPTAPPQEAPPECADMDDLDDVDDLCVKQEEATPATQDTKPVPIRRHTSKKPQNAKPKK